MFRGLLGRLRGGSQGGEVGAREVLSPFLYPDSDNRALSLELKPARADHEAFWRDGAVAASSFRYYEELWADEDMVIAPSPGQHVLTIWSATAEDIRAGNAAAGELPGGYGAVAEMLRAGLVIYGFKFTAGGARFGMTYDGLDHLNGRLVIFPKPWRAIS